MESLEYDCNPCRLEEVVKLYNLSAGKAVTAKQARLKKEEAEKCTEENAAACYDHTGNIGIGPVKASPIPYVACMHCKRSQQPGMEKRRPE